MTESVSAGAQKVTEGFDEPENHVNRKPEPAPLQTHLTR